MCILSKGFGDGEDFGRVRETHGGLQGQGSIGAQSLKGGYYLDI